jgi:hypothetical protein
LDGGSVVAIIIKTIQDLIPGTEYIVRVRAKNTDLNTYSNATDSIRFTVPQDTTVPEQVQNLSLYSSFQTVMFVYDFVSDNDISFYEYELYYGNLSAGEPTGELHSQGKAAANVFTVSVENSTTDNTAGVSNPISYSGRMRAVDATGNIGPWSDFAQSDSETPLIDEEFIASLTAAKITAGTIGAHEIILTQSGAQTTYTPPNNVAVLRSSNYSTGSDGWLIRGDGFAEFDSTHIRGNLDAGSITVGDGTYNYWNKSGSENDFRVGDASTYILWDNSAGTLTVAGDATIGGTLSGVDGTFSGTLSAVDGTFSGTLSGVGGTFTSDVTVGSHATNKITIASDATDVGTKIYAGTGTYNNSDTGFYIDASGQFSLGDKLAFDQATGALVLNGNPSGVSSDLIIEGAIIRTVQDVDDSGSTADGVVMTENDIFLFSRTSDESSIKFQGNTDNTAKIISEIKGIQLSATTSQGSPIFQVGSDDTVNENYLMYKWYGYSGTETMTLSKDGSSNPSILDIKNNTSILKSGKITLKDEGSLSSLSLNWDEDTSTGIYRYNPGTGYTGVTLVAQGVEGLSVVSQSSANTRVIMEAPVTTTVTGYSHLLHSNSYGSVHKYASSRKLKENIFTIGDVSSFFDEVRPVSFVQKAADPSSETKKEKEFRLGDIQHGFIAEEIAEIFDGKIATYDADFNPNGWRWPDMIALCVAEIKSLRKRVAQLESV